MCAAPQRQRASTSLDSSSAVHGSWRSFRSPGRAGRLVVGATPFFSGAMLTRGKGGADSSKDKGPSDGGTCLEPPHPPRHARAATPPPQRHPLMPICLPSYRKRDAAGAPPGRRRLHGSRRLRDGRLEVGGGGRQAARQGDGRVEEVGQAAQRLQDGVVPRRAGPDVDARGHEEGGDRRPVRLPQGQVRPGERAR